MQKQELQIEPRRRVLARQLVVFQIKLAVDGVKDIVLAPLGLVAGLFGLLLSNDRQGPFRAVLRLGRSFDDYIDLYSVIDDEDVSADKPTKLNQHLSRVEKAITNRVSSNRS